ncbi:PLXB1-like protein, partial [Mya arenaria]
MGVQGFHEIACQVGGESYNILTDAVFVNGMVFASFSKSDGLFESVICFKDIQQLNSSLVDEKLNFIDGNCTLNETQSYLAYEQNMEQCENLKGNTSIFFEEFKCAADMPHLTHDSKRVIGNKSILFNYSIHNIEGKITKLFTTSLNGKSIILAGTESGHVIQFSILEDGSLQKYDTSRVPSSSSREDNKIHDLYHFPDGDAFYALTKSKIFKISARPCTESDVSVCTQSVTMKMKDPHCGWCVFKNKLSKKSECNATWISLDKKCLISIRPQGVDITITSDSLPNASYICGINGGQGKARKNSSSLTCSVNVSEILSNAETNNLKNLSVKINSTNIAKQYCQFSDGKVDCNVTFKARSDAKTLENIEVQYENPKRKWISIDGKSEVFVYKCTTLSDNMCNYCQALNTSRFRCKWDNETKSCTYCSPSETCRHECPRPNITESDDFSKNITKGFICKLDKKNGNTTYFYRVNRTGESLPVNDAIIPIWKVEKCVIDDNSSAQVLCKIPAASTGIVQELNAKTSLSINRKKRSSQCDDCFTVTIIVQLDEIEHSFNLSYFHDPSISKFEGVLLYQSDQQYLEIKGENLNLVAEIHDINVTIGLGECNVVELTGSYMRCKTPSSQPKPGIPGATLPEVNVTIGNIHTTVGFIQYQQKFENFLIIAGAAAGTALFLLELVVVFFVCMNRKAGSKAKALEKQINDLEMEIKQVAKEEFLDMQTSLSTVNRNLIEQGFPYHSYQQFACNAIFATDYLMSDPVVSSYKMSDELRANARTGMERFRGLLENKFFLVSLITTMDKQTHFFIKEK